MSQTTVLVVGATGSTGLSITNALLQSPEQFEVVALVRPSSAQKEEVTTLHSRGVDIKVFDLDSGDEEHLVQLLHGVDIVISTIFFRQLQQQKLLVDASKRANVSRFIPSDFGTACPPGVRALYDEKLEIHAYIEKVGMPHTYIDVGWWSGQIIPPVEPGKQHGLLWDWLRSKIGSNETKTAILDRDDIGKFVARIILDDRTLNCYVFCWAEEVTQREVFAIAESVIGEKILITEISEENLLARMEEARAQGEILPVLLEYFDSMWIRGDNTLANAAKPEYGSALNAQELYPDIQPRKLRDVAKEFYGK